MARSAKEIEGDIRQKWKSRRTRAKGLWLEVRDQIDLYGGKRPGHLLHEDGRPMRTEEIASLANTTVTTAEGLVRQLSSVGLLSVADDGTIYSKPLVRLHEVRRGSAERKARCVKNKDESKKVLRSAKRGVTSAKGNTQVAQHPPSPPPSVSLPTTLSSSTPSPTPLSFPSEMSGKADLPRGAKFPPGVWQRAVEGYSKAWEHVHKTKFRWIGRQTKGLKDVMNALDPDFEKFEAIAKAWLRVPEVGMAKGHPLWQLATDLGHVESLIAKGSVGNGISRKPTPAERGEYGGPTGGGRRELPDAPRDGDDRIPPDAA